MSQESSPEPSVVGEKLVWESDNEQQHARTHAKRQPVSTSSSKKSSKRIKTSSRRSRLDDGEVERVIDDGNAEQHVLPDYLRQRRSNLGSSTLRLPPQHAKLHAAHLVNSQKKPAFPNSAPRAAFEDLHLYLQPSGPAATSSKPAAKTKIGVIPASIAQWLRDYQVQGVHFLLQRFVLQQGAILGDDMGLGKTIQVIAFLTAAFAKVADARDMELRRKFRTHYPSRWYPVILIVCPGSLMDNWQSELLTWGYWEVVRYHGSAQDKAQALASIRNRSAEIMLTTYGMYRRNQSAINLVEWDCVIADECHQIKDPRADITVAMNQVNALSRFGLTGTAMQNNYDELWTLLNWANPGAVSSLSSWKKLISDPLRIGQSHDATTFQHGTARRTAEKLKSDLLPQFFLRRWKSLIADQLPKKRDRIVFCLLTSTQSTAYQRFLGSSFVQTILRAYDPCPCESGRKNGWCCYAELDGGKSWQAYTFPAIQALKNMSSHLALLIPSGTEDQEKFDKARHMLQLALPDQCDQLMRQKDSIHHLSNQEFCGKWAVLLQLLKWWYEHGDKVLIFSHSVKLLKGLKLLFASTSYNYTYLDGAMPYDERTEAVNSFNNDKHQFVFLISIRAGGVGLNITSANKVVILDPGWNPAHDLQAQDRAYRIGQTRDVDVFRLISIGTIEELIYARQVYKQQQADIAYKASLERRYFTGVQANKDKKGELFGLLNLFTYKPNEIVLRQIVNKTNVAESKAGISVTDVDLQSQSSAANQDSSAQDQAECSDEDSAMQILADLVNFQSGTTSHKPNNSKNRKSNTADGIEHILAQAGVQYFHDNAEVIGTSRVESKLSRRAMERTTDLNADDEVVFAHKDQDLDQGSSDDANSTVAGPQRKHIPRFRPTEDICIRQFCSMAALHGCSVEEFATQVEAWSQKERRNFLDRFYASRAAQMTATV